MKKTALYAFLIVSSLCSTSCASRYERAVGMLDAGQEEEAIREFTTYLRGSRSRAVSDFKIHRYILQYYANTARLAEGLQFYEAFTDPALKFYIDGLYHAYLGLNSPAVSLFRKAIELRPGEGVIYYDMGLAYLKMKKFYMASAAFADAVKNDGSLADAYLELGMLYAYRVNQYENGIAWIDRALKRYTRTESDARIDALISMGKIYEMMGDTLAAISSFERAIKGNFEKVATSVDLGQLYKKKYREWDARDFWGRALSHLGYNNPQGRYYFKQYYGAKDGLLDLSGVAFAYYRTDSVTGAEKIVLANEDEYFFTNPLDADLLSKLTSQGLIVSGRRREVWRVEHMGFMAKNEVVMRDVQSRGVIASLSFSRDNKLYISVRKNSRTVRERSTRPNVGGKGGAWEEFEYWYKSDVKLALFEKGEHKQTLDFPVDHLHRVTLVDLSGNGDREIVAAGFKDDQLVVSIFARGAGGSWAERNRLSCDLASPENGFVFLNLNFSSDLEMVRFSSAISWADVYRWDGQAGYKLDNRAFKKFAEDFVERYQFAEGGVTDPGDVDRELRADRLRRYQLFSQYLGDAKSIIR